MPSLVVSAAVFDEQGRICCVKQMYGGAHWAMPGGGVEPGESPLSALEREVHEETGFIVRAGALIGVYAAPWQDRLVLCLAATVVGRSPWEPNEEIEATGFFDRDHLPTPMTAQMRYRINDAFDGKTGILHVFGDPDPENAQ